MSNILDLDSILPPKRTVKLFGKEHELRQMTLKDFIKLTRDAEKLTKGVDKGEKSQADIIEMNLTSVKYVMPTLSDEDLERLTAEQMVAIMTFARETAAAGAPAASESQGKA